MAELIGIMKANMPHMPKSFFLFFLSLHRPDAGLLETSFNHAESTGAMVRDVTGSLSRFVPLDCQCADNIEKHAEVKIAQIEEHINTPKRGGKAEMPPQVCETTILLSPPQPAMLRRDTQGTEGALSKRRRGKPATHPPTQTTTPSLPHSDTLTLLYGTQPSLLSPHLSQKALHVL